MNTHGGLEISSISKASLTRATKLHRRKYRQASGTFLAEGPSAVLAAIESGLAVSVVVAEDALESGVHADIIAASRDASIGVLSATTSQFAALADTQSPQGILAIAKIPQTELSTALSSDASLVVILVETRDPGNVGTIIRTADAAGADAVILAGDSVDPFGSKAVRSSAGSVFTLPIVVGVDPEEAIQECKAAGLNTIATSLSSEIELGSAKVGQMLQSPVAWVFGNEAHGLPADLTEIADYQLKIPMRGSAESLNLAVSVGVCLYSSVLTQSPDSLGVQPLSS